MSIYQNKTIIRIGDFFFKYRNKVFPLMIAALFLAFPPAPLLHSENAETIKDYVAIAISVIGLLVRALVVGYAYIKRGGRNKEVYADTLVTEGMFTICRNPLYFGNMLIYAGIFLLYGTPLVVFVGIALFYFIYICIIATEENYLRNKFGSQYDAYAAKTNRWIIDFTKFRTATKEMYFNLMKVIIKDYSTISTTLLIIFIVQIYKYYFRTHEWNIPLIAGAVASLAFMGIVQVLKKKKIITFKS